MSSREAVANRERRGAVASSASKSDDWRPTADWKMLRLRAEMLKTVRAFFDARGFLEVETPLVSADTVVDRHLEPMRLARSGRSTERFLQTSPEFAMKRLMAAGGEAIYQVTRAFREEERGALHNPEFTIVEWYRRGDDYAAGRSLLGEMAKTLLGRGAPAVMTYGEAFRQFVDIDPFTASTAMLTDAADRLGVAAPETLSTSDHDGWLDLLWSARVQPQLGRTTPAIVCDYPPSQAALARVSGEDPAVAERFELFADGVELANGYHELTDAEVLSRRAATANRAREQDGRERLPETSRMLGAMREGMPECAGVALGLDRVLMVVSGAERIDEVLAFPAERA